ncbi:MAG: thiamine diphosphokinase [Lachnospiraceae bacterium]|nr:thiamine diphosphokinase [Lachnospiraceae bacterium]
MSTLIITGGRMNEESAMEYLAVRCGRERDDRGDTAAFGFAHIIAVDGGVVSAERLGLKPDFVVGDFDTLPGERLKCYEQREDVVIRRFRPGKDDTDTQIAVELAIELEGGADAGRAASRECGKMTDGVRKEGVGTEQGGDVVILGGLGTRFDHTLANVLLLEKLEAAGLRAVLVDRHNRISVHSLGFSLSRAEQYGSFVSFVALTPRVTGITLTGFKYPLTRYTLRQEDSRCISNELAAEIGTVEFEEGMLLMVEARD